MVALVVVVVVVDGVVVVDLVLASVAHVCVVEDGAEQDWYGMLFSVEMLFPDNFEHRRYNYSGT